MMIYQGIVIKICVDKQLHLIYELKSILRLHMQAQSIYACIILKSKGMHKYVLILINRMGIS